MLNAAYDNFDEFINNNILNLNTQNTPNNSNTNKLNSVFNNERLRPEMISSGGKSIEVDIVNEEDFEDEEDDSENSEEEDDDDDDYSDNNEENDVNNNNLSDSTKQQLTNDTKLTTENLPMNSNEQGSLI